MQLDQKKVPVFHGEKDKDTLNILGWCARIDGMKDGLGWSDEVIFANPSAAFFGTAQRTAENWAILYKDEHRKTWTYLKKKMLPHYRNMQDSRSFIDAMFNHLIAFTADCVDAYKVVRETLPKPEAPWDTAA